MERSWIVREKKSQGPGSHSQVLGYGACMEGRGDLVNNQLFKAINQMR